MKQVLYKGIIWGFWLLGFGNLWAQNPVDTLSFMEYEIEMVQRIFETDTVLFAYYDQKIERSLSRFKDDMPENEQQFYLDTLKQFIQTPHPTVQEIKPNSTYSFILFNPRDLSALPFDAPLRTKDDYYEKAINYYYNKTQGKSEGVYYYVQLVNAWMYYKGSYGTNEKLIAYLDRAIELNPEYIKSYLMKAELLEKAALFKGNAASAKRSEHVHAPDIELAKETIKIALKMHPESRKLSFFLKRLESYTN